MAGRRIALNDLAHAVASRAIADYRASEAEAQAALDAALAPVVAHYGIVGPFALETEEGRLVAVTTDADTGAESA